MQSFVPGWHFIGITFFLVWVFELFLSKGLFTQHSDWKRNIVELGRRIPTEENHLTYAEKKNRKEEMTPRRTQNIIIPLGGEDKSFFINVVNV